MSEIFPMPTSISTRATRRRPLATDLLLGTQGWRRFATVDPAKFVAAHGDAARRALALRSQPMMVSSGYFSAPRVQPPPVPAAFGRAPAVVVGAAPPGSEFINGVVTDPSGAVIPGSTIQATNTATGVIVTRITNEAGTYVIPGLLPGTYDVTASLPGFRTTRATGLRLMPETYIRQDFPLEIANMSTMVEVSVTADNMLMSMSSSSVGQVLPQRPIKELPLVGNDVLSLINTTRDGITANPDLVGEIRLIRTPVDAELGEAMLRSCGPQGAR